MKTSSHQHAFTLVELLVVIGIIALLIGVLLPVLGKARESANSIKCASNLRSIGQLIAQYSAGNKGFLPAAVLWPGAYVVNGVQYSGPSAPTPNSNNLTDMLQQGYITWSGQILGKNHWVSDPIFGSDSGFDVFKCPSLPNGGLPPANTYNGNIDFSVVKNEVSGTAANNTIFDAQAPRLAYLLNEALTPRGRFGLVTGGNPVLSVYHYVNAAKISHSSSTILATENWGLQKLMTTNSQANPANSPVSNTRRPVSGFGKRASGTAISADNYYGVADTSTLKPIVTEDVVADPSSAAAPPATLDNTLFFVGRNHGKRRVATINGSAIAGGTVPIPNWDVRNSNFLYVDGHVETKNLADTIYPNFEWGEKFYSLSK